MALVALKPRPAVYEIVGDRIGAVDTDAGGAGTRDPPATRGVTTFRSPPETFFRKHIFFFNKIHFLLGFPLTFDFLGHFSRSFDVVRSEIVLGSCRK